MPLLTRIALSTVVAGSLIAGLVLAVSLSGSAASNPTTRGCLNSALMGGLGEVPAVGINQLVRQSDAAVVAQVTSISPPRWNSANGEPWCMTDNEPGTPPVLAFQYREVVADIKQVVFDSEALPLVDKPTVTFTIAGDGQLTDEPGDRAIISGAGFELSAHEWSENLVTRGETTLLLLEHDTDVKTKEGSQAMTSVAFATLGKWRVVGERAESKIGGRTVPLEPLKLRVKEERQAGARDIPPEEHLETAVNPLAR